MARGIDPQGDGKVALKLVDSETGFEIPVPSKRMTFRGELVTVTEFRAGRSEASSGRVYCTDEDGCSSEWYPGVINSKIVEA